MKYKIIFEKQTTGRYKLKITENTKEVRKTISLGAKDPIQMLNLIDSYDLNKNIVQATIDFIRRTLEEHKNSEKFKTEQEE